MYISGAPEQYSAAGASGTIEYIPLRVRDCQEADGQWAAVAQPFNIYPHPDTGELASSSYDVSISKSGAYSQPLFMRQFTKQSGRTSMYAAVSLADDAYPVRVRMRGPTAPTSLSAVKVMALHNTVSNVAVSADGWC